MLLMDGRAAQPSGGSLCGAATPMWRGSLLISLRSLAVIGLCGAKMVHLARPARLAALSKF